MKRFIFLSFCLLSLVGFTFVEARGQRISGNEDSVFVPDPFRKQMPVRYRLELPGEDLALLRQRYALLKEGTARMERDGHVGVRRLPSGALRISGVIGKEMPALLRQLITLNDTVLELNSGGGDALAAMEMGRLIHERRIELRVDGICMSACANYLLPAAKRLSGSGLIGFHGDPNALLEQEGLEIWRKLGLKKYLSVQHAAWSHRKFVEELGINDCLSRASQVDHRGAGSGVWSFYVPNEGDSRLTGLDMAGLLDISLLKAFMLYSVETGDGLGPLFYQPNRRPLCALH